MSGGPSVRASPASDLYTTNVEAAENVRATLVRSAISASAWGVIIDLSDTTNWPHNATGQVIISLTSLIVDKASSTQGSMAFYLATRVGTTDGDATLLSGVGFSQAEVDSIERDVNYSPSQLRCLVQGGLTPHIITNGRIVNDTGIRSDLALDSPLGAGTVIPQVGDILVRYTHTAGGAWTGGTSLMYRGASVNA